MRKSMLLSLKLILILIFCLVLHLRLSLFSGVICVGIVKIDIRFRRTYYRITILFINLIYVLLIGVGL